MTTTQKENAQPSSIILDGHNYTQWATTMRSYLKEMRLWHVVTRERTTPIRQKKEYDDKYADRLEE